uniref:Melanoregulin-like n=1 Tax=Sinocyclocheilus grahami TaxID=75366 RepID=A0A672MA45_SINGR
MGAAFKKFCMRFCCCCCCEDDEEEEKRPLLRPVMSSVPQGYRRLSIDIEAMRDMRREVRDKWKMILENLGFMAEAESLLTVSTSASNDRMRNAAVARNLLQTLHTETSLFNSREPPPERYLFILDRLIYLDAAEDFVAKARRFYPPKDDDDDDDDEEENTNRINLPLLLSRMNQNISGGEDEDDED